MFLTTTYVVFFCYHRNTKFNHTNLKSESQLPHFDLRFLADSLHLSSQPATLFHSILVGIFMYGCSKVLSVVVRTTTIYAHLVQN